MNIDINNNEIILNFGDLFIAENGDYYLVVNDGVNNVALLDIKDNMIYYTHNSIEVIIKKLAKMEHMLKSKSSRVKEIIDGRHLSLTLKR